MDNFLGEERESFLTANTNGPQTSSLSDLEGAIVDAEEADRESGHDFDGNLYLFFALKSISTPAKSLRYTNDIHHYLKEFYAANELSSSSLPGVARSLRNSAAMFARRDSALHAHTQKRAFLKVLKTTKTRNPFARVLQMLLRIITPILQIAAPLCIILRAYEKVESFKHDWIEKCGDVKEFCMFMKTYRFNFFFNPDVTQLHGTDCIIGEAGIFKMNKFFMFNPYAEAEYWRWMSKILCVAFLFAVGVRVSVDFNLDYSNRQKAILIARSFLRNIEEQLPASRGIWTPYVATRLWIVFGGFVRIASAVLMLTAMALCLWGTEVPRDVVMDALGLVFIYHLDAVGSEFSLLSTKDWDPVWMGRLYSMVMEPQIAKEISSLKARVLNTYKSDPGARAKTNNYGEAQTSVSNNNHPLIDRSGDGDDIGSLGSSVQLNLKDVMFRNMAEEVVLRNVSHYPRVEEYVVHFGRCIYMIYLVMLLLAFMVISPPYFSPTRTNTVVHDRLAFMCLVQSDGTEFYSKP